MQRHVGQQILPSISHHDGLYTIENARDFRWETENAAKQQFLTVDIYTREIRSCRLYKSTFGFQSIAHYMVGFLYINSEGHEKEIIFSIEARRPIGGSYSLWKGIIPGMYDMIYIRGTPQDLLDLRTNVWHDPLTMFPMILDAQQTQQLFSFFVHKTNTPSHKWKRYNAIIHNCITDLHIGLSSVSDKLATFTRRSIFSKGYSDYLLRHKILTLQGSKTI